MLLGTCIRAVVRCVLCALSGFVAPGSRRCLASGRVPWCGRGRASLACLVALPGAPRLVRSGRSRFSGRLSQRRGAFLHPGGLRPPLYWLAARGTRRPAENRAHYACRWPPPRQDRWAPSASYPFRAPRWGCPWRVPPTLVLGCARMRWLACVDLVPDASGFPYRLSLDRGLGRCTEALSCGRRHLPLRVGGRHAGVLCMCACASGAFWCASPFPFAVLSFCFVRPPPGWGCPFLVFLLPSPPSPLTGHSIQDTQPGIAKTRPPSPTADPSQDWRGTAPKALSLDWRGPNYYTHTKPLTQRGHTRHIDTVTHTECTTKGATNTTRHRTKHESTSRTPRTHREHDPLPHTADPGQEWLGTTPRAPSQKWRGPMPRALSQYWGGTTRHHQQQIPARNGRDLSPAP